MKKKSSLFAVLFSLILAMQASPLLFQSVNAQARVSDGPVALSPAVTSADSVAVIVELEGAPVAEHVRSGARLARRDRRADFQLPAALRYEAQLDGEQADFESRAALISPALRIRTKLKTVVNAVSMEVPANDVAAIAALPGVKRVEYVKQMQATLNASLSIIGASAMWDHLGGSSNAGEGMKIAILDTGIDITNPMFSGDGFTAPAGFPRTDVINQNSSLTNNKVIVAKSFLASNSSGKRTAEDEEGHGSNVAGIAGGNFGIQTPLGPVSGVAPRAWLGNYRVLDKAGRGVTDMIARGVEEAVKDGFDVANLSLGGGADSQLDVVGESVQRAVAEGMIVVVAAGNAGEDGEMTIGSPGVAPSAITVAATTNSHLVGAKAAVSGPGPVPAALENIIMISGAGGPSLDNSFVSLAYVDVSALGGGGRGCGTLPSGSLSGKIALIERGGISSNGEPCSFAVKVNTAEAAGAKAVIIYNKDISEGDDGGETLITMTVPETRIPAVFIARSNGLALKEFVKSHNDARVSLNPVASISSVSDVIAPFSSQGPSSLEALKPDISAPGTYIYSADIRSTSPDGFSAVSGTSQATPHVAGAAALIKQLHPTWTPAQVKSALMNTASSDVFTTTARSAHSGLLAMGAGRVDLTRTASVTATFSPASISFGINKLKKKTVSLNADFSITNVSDSENTFTISIEPLDPGEGVIEALVSQSPTPPLAAGQTRTTKLFLTATKKAKKRDYTGFIKVTDSQGQTFRVPYWVRFVKKK
jgi:minor extracellular serine protease Vpr